MNEPAKLLLSAYRPGGADATDPAFAEALAQAKSDPQLRAWLEESQQFDAAIAGKLRGLAVPPDLRGNILAGAKFSSPRRWWQKSRVWSLAALVAVVASIAAFWVSTGSSLETWQSDSLAVLEKIETGDVHFDSTGREPARLVDWLRANAAPVPAALPPALVAQETFGCKTIELPGRKVSLICFNLGGENEAHLFTTARAGLENEPPEKGVIFGKKRQWNLASWRSGGDVHMLATNQDEAGLRALLPESIVIHRVAGPAAIAELLPIR